MQFEFTELSDAERALQVEVREFLATTLPRGSFEPGLGMAGRKDPEFSRALAAARVGGHVAAAGVRRW